MPLLDVRHLLRNQSAVVRGTGAAHLRADRDADEQHARGDDRNGEVLQRQVALPLPAVMDRDDKIGSVAAHHKCHYFK